MKVKSNIKTLAQQNGLNNPQDLSHRLVVSWPTANKLWKGDLDKSWLKTLLKVATLFGCTVDDLFEIS